MAVLRSPKPLVGVRVSQGPPNLFLHSVMVTQQALNLLSLVRFQVGVPKWLTQGKTCVTILT